MALTKTNETNSQQISSWLQSTGANPAFSLEAVVQNGRQTRLSDIIKGTVSFPFNWLKRINEKSRLYGELSMLDDRILDDIGIRRSEIGAVVYGGLNRKNKTSVPQNLQFFPAKAKREPEESRNESKVGSLAA